jgi:hypothetical protein
MEDRCIIARSVPQTTPATTAERVISRDTRIPPHKRGRPLGIELQSKS